MFRSVLESTQTTCFKQKVYVFIHTGAPSLSSMKSKIAVGSATTRNSKHLPKFFLKEREEGHVYSTGRQLRSNKTFKIVGEESWLDVQVSYARLK